MRGARPTDPRAGHRFRPGPTSSAETAAGSSETRSGSGIALNAGGNFKSKQGEKTIKDNCCALLSWSLFTDLALAYMVHRIWEFYG